MPASLCDLIICSNQMAFHPTTQFEALEYEPTSSPKQVVLVSKRHNSGSATVTYTFDSAESKNAPSDEFKRGKRLLVGRYCLCPAGSINNSGSRNSDSKVKCRVVEVKGDKSCILFNLDENKLCEKPVKVALLTFIESYGVSVYKNAPKMEHSGCINFKVQDPTVLNLVQWAIQKAQVVASKRVFSQLQSKQSLEGQLVISVVEVRDLQGSHGEIKQVYCNVQQEGKDSIQTEVIRQQTSSMLEQTRFASTSNLAKITPFCNSKNPLGSILNLGFFCLDPRLPAPITVSVHSENLLLGECRISTNQLFGIDPDQFNPAQLLKDQARESLLLLKTKEGKVAGSVLIQVRFKLDAKTQALVNQFKAVSLASPAAQLHFDSILGLRVHDSWGFEVHAGTAARKDSEWPLGLKGQNGLAGISMLGEQAAQSSEIQMDVLASQMSKFLRLGVFMSREEALDVQMSKKQEKRSLSQTFSHNHRSLWLAQKEMMHNDLFRQIGEVKWREFWTNFPQRNVIIGKEHGSDLSQTSLIETIKQIQSSDAQPHTLRLFNRSSPRSIFLANIPESHVFDAEHFSELHKLVSEFGFQGSERFQMWRDIMKTQLLEIHEHKYFLQQPGFLPSKTVFQNLWAWCQEEDSLASKQVDQDLAAFKLPNSYQSHLTPEQQQFRHLSDKLILVQVLKTLLFWSAHSTQQFTYSLSLLRFMHTVLVALPASEHRAEELFWIMASLTRLFPRSFTVSDPVLTENPMGTMRYELVCLKALVEKNLPDVYLHLKTVGLPIEMLVYGPMQAKYAGNFCTDVCLVLWDKMVLGFANADKDQRKEGLWYILAPVLMVFKAVRRELLQAETFAEITNIFEKGFHKFLNAEKFLKVLSDEVTALFFEKQVEKPRMFSLLEYMFGKKVEIGNISAYDMENLRHQYQQKTQAWFEKVQEENKAIKEYTDNLLLAKGQPTELPAYVNQFRGMVPERVSERLKSVHIYIDSLTRMLPNQNIKYDIEISYGTRINGKFIGEKTHKQPFSGSQKIGISVSFDFVPGYDQIQITLGSRDGQHKFLSLSNLKSLEVGKFVRCRSFLTNPLVQNNEEGFQYQFGQFEQLIFLQPFTSVKLGKLQELFVRKSPGVIDLYTQHAIENTMAQDFRNVVQQNQAALSQLYSSLLKDNEAAEQLVLQIINDTYNYVDLIDRAELKPAEIEVIQDLTRSVDFEDTHNLISGRVSRGTMRESLEMSLSQSFKGALRSQALDRLFNLNQDQPVRKFSSRAVIVTLFLFANGTTQDKLDALFEIFLASDLNLPNKLRIQQLQMMVQTVFERSLYFMPKIEIQNMVETVCCNHENMLKAAYWTMMPAEKHNKLIYGSQGWRDTVCQFTPDEKGLLHSSEDGQTAQVDFNIDVTSSVRQSFADYFQIFGTKLIEFASDCSPFRSLETLLTKRMASLLRSLQRANSRQVSTIVLYLSMQGESIKFFLRFLDGKLVYSGSTHAGDEIRRGFGHLDLTTFSEKASGNLDLNPSGGITQKEFHNSINKIPMLAELIRAQTLFAGRGLTAERTKEAKAIVYVPVGCQTYTFKIGEPKVPMDKFNLYINALKQQNLMADLRLRMHEAVQDIPELQAALFNSQWQVLTETGWDSVQDFERIGTYTESVFKLVKLTQESHQRKYDCLSLYKHADQSYQWRPCRIVFRELKKTRKKQISNQMTPKSDRVSRQSYEVIQNARSLGRDEASPPREEFSAQSSARSIIAKLQTTAELQFDQLKYVYTVEFEHLPSQEFWCRRRFSEVMLSPERTRFEMPKFFSSNQLYILQLYSPLEL